MKVLAIIAEYNPMHNGHIYQISEAKKLISPDYCIAIMSGNFTQRGELSLLSKWEKAAIAVKCGLDLVIELPTVFACNNAEYFAKGAVEILNRLKTVTHLAFGSECGDIKTLSETSEFLITYDDNISHKIKELSKSGISYFEAQKKAVAALSNSNRFAIFSNSNDILAIEYIKKMKLTDSTIMPVAIKRCGGAFNSINTKQNAFLSATAIRNFLSQKENFNSYENIENFVPIETLKALKSGSYKEFQKRDELYFAMLGANILNENTDLAQIFSITEGLENRILRCFKESASLSSLKQKLYSKRYAKSRINRSLSHILLGITKKDISDMLNLRPYYARILAFNAAKTELLKTVKKNKADDLPLITNLNKEINQPALKNNPLLNFDIKASNIFALLTLQSFYDCSDLTHSPVKIDG